MKKIIQKLANKAICAAFVVLGAFAASAELVKTPILDADNVSVGYKVTGLENGEVAMVYTNHLKTATWSVPYDIENVEFLVVGGGGGGGASTENALGGGGGGGGCVVTGILKNVSFDSRILIKVGSGTEGGKYTVGQDDRTGEAKESKRAVNDSYFLVNGTTNVIAYCGGRELGYRKPDTKGNYSTSGGYGGSNAGSRNKIGNSSFPDGRKAYVNDANMHFYKSFQKGGGVAYANGAAAAGGGGGATHKGSDSYENGDGRNGGNGGEGLASDITGTRVVYGSGGGGGTTRSCKTYWADSDYTNESMPGQGGEGAGNGGSYGDSNLKDEMNPGKSGLANQGGGGGGGGNKANGGNGGSGIVVFRYVEPVTAVAQIGDQTFETLEAAFAAATEGQEIDLLQDATPALTSQRAITKAAVIDLGGKTLTLTEDDLYFGTTTFKNGTIVVDPSVKPSTAVFWMFANQTLTFDNVKIVATGVTGTYLIGLEGTNCDLNLLNGSEILVENTTALDLDIICDNGSTDNDIVIDNSKINVTNLDGRVLFNGNYTIKGTSEINLAGITKAGIRIQAGETLSIEDTAKVTIAGEPRDGGIHLTDVTAIYTKADTATVTATINEVPAVAKIGSAKYASLQTAINAVKNDETITLVADCAENVTATEKVGLYYTIDGAGKTMTGSIAITALSDTNDNRRITIKNFNFVDTTAAEVSFISAGASNYYPRFTVEDCTFTGSGDATDVAVRVKDGNAVIIKDCTGTGLHSFLQNTAGWNLTIENVEVTNSKSGLALGTVQGVMVKGCEIAVAGYGIRMDAQYNNNAALESNKISAFIPVVVRKASVDSNVTVSGTNEMTPSNTDGLWFAIGTSEYEENDAMPTAPTGKVVVTLNDTGLNASGVYGNYGVALVNGVKYVTLKDAVAAVADGGTITLIGNVTITEATRTHNSGSWYDGIYYVGDKSFTIDLGGFTVTHDGAVNDYLLNFKNDGAKENTITLKNGTIDAGTAAFCAICTSGTSTQKITINTENINIVNNISNGSTVKIRGGAEFNAKAGTKITGKNSYLGIECVASAVNIYDGAEIYMNGTSSYNGCLVGACGNGVVNVYGGYGKGVKGGFIAMTSGGTINVSGGEWIANTNGTIGDNSNVYVLTAQNNKQESGYAGASIINVTGGTFRGGMDAWILNDANVEKAELNIAGGNFNANPTAYLDEGYVVNVVSGVYTVAKAVAKIGTTYYTNLVDAFKAATEGCTIEILADVTIDYKWDCRDYATNGSHSQFKEAVTINGNGHTLKFTGTVNDANWNTIFRFEENATVNNLTVDISEATGAQRVISAKKSLTVDGLTIVGSAKYGIVFGEGASAAELAASEIVVKNSTLTGTRRAISDNEGGKDVKSVVITDNTLNANVYASASESITFNNNTAAGEVDLRSYTAENVLSVEAKGNTLTAGVKNYIYAKTIDAQADFTAERVPTTVSTYEELIAALAEDNAYVVLANDITATATQESGYGKAGIVVEAGDVLDGNGKTLTINGANATWGCVIAMKGGEVRNLTIAGAMRGVFMPGANGDVVIDNCKFQNVIYTFNSDAGSKDYTVTIKNTELNGWTSFSDAHKAVVFDTCTFAKGNGYAYCRPYQATTFNNCSFSGDFAIDCSYANDNKLAFNGCAYNGQAITSENAFGLFGDGSKVLVNGAPADYTRVAQVGTQFFADLQEAIKAAAPAGTVTLLKDVVVDEWKMVTEDYNIASDQLITLTMNGLTIDGNGKTLTVKAIESAGNGGYLFQGASNLTVKKLTINVAAGLVGGIGLKSGTVENVTFNGGTYAVLPGTGNVTVKDCTFNGITGSALYFEEDRDNLVITANTFNCADGAYAVTLRGAADFTNNTVLKGKVNLANSAKGEVSGNDFGTERFKVYNGATAQITGNTINNLVFNDATVAGSTFENNTLSESAQTALDAVMPKLAGSGTEAEPYLINNVADLVLFRDSVNKGETKYNAPGVWVALGADIDMAGAEWTVGIGDGHTYSFDACFDGNNKTIKNLTLKPYADSENPETAYICGGLFGYTYGAVTIKDLVLENITVTTDAAGHNVGALVGFANNKGGKLNVSGVTVKNVNIDAPNASGVGAIVGYSYREMGAIENCSVDGTAIKGQNFVGGITGYSYSNAQIKNCSVTNVAITATSKFVGGIAGIIGDNTTISGCTADATVSGTACVGSIVGAISGNGLSLALDNCTVMDTTLPEIGGNYSDDAAVVAKVGNKYYTTFAEAYAAAQADDTITLLRNVTLTSKLTLNKAVTIDGNGHSIVADSNTQWYTVSGKLNTKNYSPWIVVKAQGSELKNVVIDCNSCAGGVKIEKADDVIFDTVSIINSKADTLTVVGSLVIENYFKAEGSSSTIDARNGVVTVAEGTIFDMDKFSGNVSPSKCDLKAAVDTNGKPYFCAYGSTTYYRTSTSITGTIGTITDLTLLDDVSLNKDITVKGTLDLNGKTLTLAEGKVLKTGGNLTITGGTFAGPVRLTDASHSLTAPEGVEVTTTVAGSRVVYADGKYTVQAINYVAQIGETKYETLAAALTAAHDGDTVELLWAEGNAPIAMNGSVFGKSVTITGTATVDWSKGFLFVGRGGEGNGTVIFDNANLASASNNASTGIHVSGREKNTNNKYDGTVVINNSTIELDYLIDKGAMTMTNSTLTVKNGFAVGGRPASETESGADATATFDLTNGSTLIVNNHNGMGLGYEAIGVMTIDSISTFECTQSFLVTGKGVLKSAGNVFGDIVKSANAQIELTGGIYTDEEVQGWCAEPYAALPNLNDQYVVGVKPTATVNSFGATTVPADEYGVWNGSSYTGTSTVDMPLSFVMQFLADQTAADMATSPFADWYGDFVITFTGINNDSFIADGCYLAGYYGDFGWVKIPVDGMKIEEGVRYPVMLGVGLGQKYDYICSGVQNFKCALFITPAILEANPDLKVKLELAVVDNSQGSDSAASALVNNDKVFSVTEYEYGAEAFAPALPTATVTSIDAPEGTPLTFALNFKADDVTDEQLAYYRDWYADFVLTITGLPEEGVTFNTDGTADGYLAGQYDAWSENWVSVPFEDVTLRNGESIKIMEYAATLMGQSGLKLTYNDVYSFVKNFDCGVYFTPEFLAANPDMKVSLSLRMYKTGDATDEGVAIGEMEEFSAPTVVAKIGSTPYATLEAAIAAAGADDTVTILKNVGTDAAIQVAKKVTIDLNGKTIAATENDKVGDGVFCVVASGDLTINDSVGTGVINGVGDNDYNIAIWANGGKVTINGGNYTNVGATDKTDPNAHFDLIYAKNGGEVIINGGTFECETPAFTLNSHDTYKGVITVNGGTFVGFDPRNNAAETAGTTFMAAGKYTFAEGGNYIVVTPEDYILNGTASDSATVGDVDSLLAGAVTVTKDGEKYVATATYTFKVTVVDTVNPEKSSYELTGGKLRPGKTVAVKYIDLATGAESWVKPESDTVTFKLVIK